MKVSPRLSASIIGACYLLQSCAGFQTGLNDDAFAHSMKSGNSRMAVVSMEPAQARLHIQERDGRWYYPIHYAICRGDAETTFALLRNGSPSSLDGRSLAYNAARVHHEALARELVHAGYGSSSDISQALVENQRDRAGIARSNAAAAAGVVALFALLGSSGGGSSSGSYDSHTEAEQELILKNQDDANRRASAGY